MKRAWSGFCLLAALCGLTTAVGLAEPLRAANPEGAGADNTHCPYLHRMREGCFRGDDPFYIEGSLSAVEEELPYLPAPVLGPLWGEEDAGVAEDVIDHEWEVYRAWREGLWYHDYSALPEPSELDLWLELADSLRGEIVRLYVEAALEIEARPVAAVGAALANVVEPAAVAAIAEPHDIYASEYYRLPGDEAAVEDDVWGGGADFAEEAPADLGLGLGENAYWDAIEGGYDEDSVGDMLGELDDYVWGRPMDREAEADTPWYIEETEDAPAAEANEDAFPYEADEDYSFSYSDVIRRLYERSVAALCPAEMSGISGQYPLAPEQAKLAAEPVPAPVAEGYAAEYVPEYEAPADDGYWAEGVESYDETSPIPYREDLDSPAYPETDESWEPSPVESALHNEVRPMTRGLAAGQGAELSLGW